MLPRGALVPRDDSATVPLPTRMGATWCAVGEGTTHTSTPRCGNAIANSTGAALWSATRVVSGQRCSPANNGITCKWTEQITTSEESGVQQTTTASFCTSSLLRGKKQKNKTRTNTKQTTLQQPLPILLRTLQRMVRFGWLAVVTDLETRVTGLRWCWQPHETFSLSLFLTTIWVLQSSPSMCFKLYISEKLIAPQLPWNSKEKDIFSYFTTKKTPKPCANKDFFFFFFYLF